MIMPRETHKGWTITGRRPNKAWPMARTVADKADQYDKVDKPLRRWDQVDGWWFTPHGPRWWVRESSGPKWIGDYYYIPGRWGPVVPPKQEWIARGHEARFWPFQGPTGAPRSDVVPDDVRYYATYHGRNYDDPSEHTQAWQARRNRLATGETVHRYGAVKWFGDRAFR